MSLRKIACLLLALTLLSAALPLRAEDAVPTPEEVQERMLALQDAYYEGRSWTNEQSYAWKGDYSMGYGCMGFAFILSDEAFGDLPARQISDIDYDSLQVGDILRINNDSHSVVILEKYDDHVVLAEGNFNSAIHWGREISREAVEKADYALTRYPDSSAPAATATPAPTATPKPARTPRPTKNPAYSLKNISYNGTVLSGTLEHHADTPEDPTLSLRVTFYIQGNYYMATTAEIESDGSFSVEGVGPIMYITLAAMGTVSDGHETSSFRYSVAEMSLN